MAAGRNVNTFSLKQVKTIVESSPDYENITEEGVHLIAAATKCFLEFLSTESYKRSCSDTLEYKHVSEYIAEDSNVDFLREIVPKKIRVSDLKQMLWQQGIEYEFPPEAASSASSSKPQEKVIPFAMKNEPSTSYASTSQQGYVSNFTDRPTTSYARQENDSCSESTNSVSPSPSYSSLSSEVRSTVIMHDEASDNSESEP